MSKEFKLHRIKVETCELTRQDPARTAMFNVGSFVLHFAKLQEHHVKASVCGCAQCKKLEEYCDIVARSLNILTAVVDDYAELTKGKELTPTVEDMFVVLEGIGEAIKYLNKSDIH